MIQEALFNGVPHKYIRPFTTQLLKWIGNKQRFGHEIVASFPNRFGRYFEPFVGSGGVLATLAPRHALASDSFAPLIEIWSTLKVDPGRLKAWYRERWQMAHGDHKKEGYERIKASYNRAPNGADLLFLCRCCYGGVVRFRQFDGYMSTPCGVHEPIPPDSFDKRTDLWHERIAFTEFAVVDYRDAMKRAGKGDLVYCDPPYRHSQSILYSGQQFKLEDLFEEILQCKARGVYVALSIDGTKKSGDTICDLPIPTGLFEEEIFVNVGRSMLRRFQMGGQTLESEMVADRLLLTYRL
ncbi:MAG: DNA adenine methylase [Syntrophorhabdales bacterium]|jgi:DNA adenine methylase